MAEDYDVIADSRNLRIMNIPEHIQDVFAKATCVYSRQDVEAAFDKMATEIHDKLADHNPVLMCVLKGGLVLTGNLLPRLDFPLELDHVHATRYQGKLTGSELEWKIKPSANLQGRTVLIIDDILDSGITLAGIVDYCRQKGAAKIYTAVLVNKLNARLPGGLEQTDFVGLEVDNRYVFGYGLDYREYLRNAPGIYEVAPEHQ